MPCYVEQDEDPVKGFAMGNGSVAWDDVYGCVSVASEIGR